MLNLNPLRNLWTLLPWKSQFHLISMGSPCVIYHTENTALQDHQSSLKFNVLKQKEICMVKNKGKPQTFQRQLTPGETKMQLFYLKARERVICVGQSRGEMNMLEKWFYEMYSKLGFGVKWKKTIKMNKA